MNFIPNLYSVGETAVKNEKEIKKQKKSYRRFRQFSIEKLTFLDEIAVESNNSQTREGKW